MKTAGTFRPLIVLTAVGAEKSAGMRDDALNAISL
jgi:hypothetical protein